MYRYGFIILETWSLSTCSLKSPYLGKSHIRLVTSLQGSNSSPAINKLNVFRQMIWPLKTTVSLYIKFPGGSR